MREETESANAGVPSCARQRVERETERERESREKKIFCLATWKIIFGHLGSSYGPQNSRIG